MSRDAGEMISQLALARKGVESDCWPGGVSLSVPSMSQAYHQSIGQRTFCATDWVAPILRTMWWPAAAVGLRRRYRDGS
ncbi:MAG: hypothetical protein R2789_11595 [Microthrixaceae bacterium]